MRIGNRPERRVANRCYVQVECRVLRELARIMETERHNKIVRMLRIHQRRAVSGFARLEKQRIAAVCNGCRLQAEHDVSLEGAL